VLTVADGSTVLIVDDSAAQLMSLHQILRDSYEVVTARGGHAAVDLIEDGLTPDLVLLDVSMPDFDGVTLCALFKLMPRLAQVPVVFLTAYASEEIEEKVFSAGAVDMIAKPASPGALLARVRTHLALHHARERLARQNRSLRTSAVAATTVAR
jgi:PleD family two-component response regulator